MNRMWMKSKEAFFIMNMVLGDRTEGDLCGRIDRGE